MRKLYSFLLGMMLLLSVSSVQAQTYAITDYLVRMTTGSGSTWNEISGTSLGSLNSNPIYYNVQKGMQVPFNIRFLNTQITATNTFAVNGVGSVILSPTWNYGYDFDAYYYSYIYYGYNYGSPYDLANDEYGYSTYYAYYPNYKLAPYEFYNYNYGSTADFQWTVLGSAPNRQLVVQAKNVPAYQYGSSPTLKGSWQTVVYESGISNFQFNYGPQSGTFGGSWGYSYDGGYYSYGEGGYTAVKSTGGHYVSIGWNGNGWDATRQPQVRYGTYSYDGADVIRNDTAQYLPQMSYRIFIAHDYDFSADAVVNPPNNAIRLKDIPQTLQASITNQGRLTPTSVTVRFQISPYGGGAPVYTHDTTLTGSQVNAPFTSKTITFPSYTPTAYGIYEDSIFVFGLLPTADQNTADNVASDEWTVSPPNNVRTLQVLSPAPNQRTPINITTPISIRFKNIGANNQTNVPVSAYITDPTGAVVYRDTVIIANWPSGQVYDTTFKDWLPALNGVHKLCGVTLLSTDQLHADDTSCASILVRYESDVAAISVLNPQPDEEKPYTTRWQPVGIFQSVGVSDLFDVPARVQIKRCSDGALVFQADSIIPELNVDQNLVRFSFPSKQGQFDIAKITPGCYTQCVIANYSTDGDRSNDTACTTFSVIDRLKGDIFVGVGQRFQTLHAAVDSLRFRGVGGNVRLILTDANYTENGNTSVTTAAGALDFSGITGVSDTSRISIIPNVGVTPRIVFTGSRPYCFYFGHFGPSWITIDGYNPRGVRIADGFLPEPNKRGITIVDNSTAAGGIFSLEAGPHNFNLRNLNLIGNGMMTNDSDAVVRLFLDASRRTFLSGIFDTLPVHDNTIENCEVANGKYGIWAHGVRTQFSLGPSKYLDFTNYNNTFARNTIGSATDGGIGFAGIQFNNEHNLTIAHNDISWVNANLSGASGAYGIAQGSTLRGDTGNVYQVWIDANRVHNLTGANTYGIAINQAATIYSNGSGVNAVRSVLRINTQNRATNNMIYDLRGTSTSYPLSFQTMANNYFTDHDSIFNNSISSNNATVNIYVSGSKHAFIWNNIIQNTGAAGAYTNYYLQLPRPFVPAISSDYNLFDLRGANQTFAIVREYDPLQGTFIQQRTFRRLNDWRTFTAQDFHSQQGDPLFAADSLHLPNALSYVASPASNNGAWLGSASQRRDFDGDLRLQGNQTPNIGADENNGFQYTNDLQVSLIQTPGGYSATSDTTFVTMENPLYITALVKNLSSQAVFGRSVTAKLEVAQAGGPWQTIFTQTSAPMNFDVAETKSVTFKGPALDTAQVHNSVYRVTVTVPNDQNNSNNVQTKYFTVLLKTQAIVVSYDGTSAFGRTNRDSVVMALNRLGLNYDLLDRTTFGSQDVNYTPWWTLIWSGGDPSTPFNALNPNLGSGALSFKETQEVERYLQAGQTYAKKSLIIAGQNIGFYNDFSNINSNNVTDTEFTRTYLHSKYVANSPVAGAYSCAITGSNLVYWKYPDNINSTSPDVIKPSITTPLVGPEIAGLAYYYNMHPSTPNDSGAGTSYVGPTYNTVYYGFDWSDPIQSNPLSNDALASGTTRVLKGALDFIQSHAGTILPVEFVNVDAKRVNTSNALITWQTARQTDVARFDVQMMNDKNEWSNVGSVDANKFAFTQTGLAATKTYTFQVIAVDNSGLKTFSHQVEVGPAASNVFDLGQNYPNPFSPSTTISYTLPVNSLVTFRILDVTGKVVRTPMTNEAVTAGTHELPLTVGDLASGSYVYEMVAVQPNGESVVLTKKMTITK